jgi:hypothetical protein
MSINLQTGTNRIHKHTHTHRINTVRTNKGKQKRRVRTIADRKEEKRRSMTSLYLTFFVFYVKCLSIKSRKRRA